MTLHRGRQVESKGKIISRREAKELTALLYRLLPFPVSCILYCKQHNVFLPKTQNFLKNSVEVCLSKLKPGIMMLKIFFRKNRIQQTINLNVLLSVDLVIVVALLLWKQI